MMSMPVAMVAMMAPTAAPFFFAYARRSRRLAGILLVVVIYAAAWAAIGAAVDYAMGWVMIPSSWALAAVAVALAAAYTVAPWSRWARAQCREMCGSEPRGSRLDEAARQGLRYTACCVVCSAGVMAAVIVVGMSNIFVMVAAALLMLGIKLTPWPQRAFSPSR
jgi:predicted metal-binding membrane protein